MSVVESPGAFPESPLDDNDVVYPCKGCGEILEEGKAFELAGNRWHIDCFRCNTCGTLLDSDANLLLLGDGSLICNNCTYSCNACGNKIEDLAILTGDQAFCAACFRCRNCKRKIENLRYARTSQGIFCMSCHESLMARRRKKAKATRQASAAANGTAPIVLDKSLPALPPNAVSQSALSDITTPTSDYTETPTERSPRPVQRVTRKEVPSAEPKRDVSPISDDSTNRPSQGDGVSLLTDSRTDNLTLPASTYRQERLSSVSSISASEGGDDDRDFLPMAFDPNPAPGPPPISQRRLQQMQDPGASKGTENQKPRDYFTGRTPSRTHRDLLRERPSSSRSGSLEREASLPPSKGSSPHIAYQEKGRQPSRKRETSANSTPASGSALASPNPNVGSGTERLERPRPQHLNSASYTLAPSENFKLQEVPESRKSGRRSNGRSPNLHSPMQTPPQAQEEFRSVSPISVDTPNSGINPFDDPKLREANGSAALAAKTFDRPARGDSLAASVLKNTPAQTRYSPETTTPAQRSPAPAHHERGASSSSVPSFADAPPFQQRDSTRSIPRPMESPLRNSVDVIGPPPRNSSRPSAPSKSVGDNADFIAPRVPPPPPPAERQRRNESVTSFQSDNHSIDIQFSPTRGGLPKHNGGGDFSMEEEMQRILRGGDDRKNQGGDSPSVLRRVSNAVKHGRSFSDRAVPARDNVKPLISGPLEISSPMSITSPINSPAMLDDVSTLRSQLRRAQQRIAELEAEKVNLEDRVNSSADIKQANTELREKRSTMAFLDTQREMVVKELEIMTEHLARAKDSNQPLDITSLKSEVLKDFANSMQKLKDNLGVQIEDLIHRRNELTDEISNLIQVKDKGLQEFETLSTKNMQLQELNAQIVTNIQDVYKANRMPNGSTNDGRSPSANGLGIYTPAGRTDTSTNDLRSLISSTGQPETTSLSNLLPEGTDAEPAHILTAPQVVNIRKGQPKKTFNWKKGGQAVKKNVTKGLKGAFAGGADRLPVNARDGQYTIDGMPYSSMQAGPGAVTISEPIRDGRQGADAKQSNAGFGFFGQKNQGLRPGMPGGIKSSSSTNLLIAEPPSVLFGSELSARCDYEKRVIPSIVTRCIDEVELRGMDVEGVYRKSGGSGQVKLIQAGFEKDGTYDISDEDLDIHAVTSALKQYFRKLPTPLITYDVYDSFLEAGQVTEKEKQQAAMKETLNLLPQSHRDVLEYLVGHLGRVMGMESQNLMTPLNLSVVFAPTIMRPLSIEREMTDMQAQRMAVQALLENGTAVFES